MRKTYRIIYSAQAYDDLRQIRDYIARHSPENARKTVARLIDAADDLNVLPHRYAVVENPGAAGGEVRSLPMPPYLIRFEIDERNEAVTIMAVRHGARKLDP